MNEVLQHWIVYTVVLLSTFQLTRPIWEMIYRKIKNRNVPQEPEEQYGYYKSSCSKCNLRR